MKFNLSQAQLMAAAKHAESRGMTLEEYIDEFIGLIHEHNKNNPDKPLDLAKWPVQDKVSSNS
jgi:hypothetical protein|tara:strand:+ start:323 stop:511 length:189 start_codon:yes stop_codon:yes gene_type:complete